MYDKDIVMLQVRGEGGGGKGRQGRNKGRGVRGGVRNNGKREGEESSTNRYTIDQILEQ